MKKNRVFRIISSALCGVMGLSVITAFPACGKSKKDSIVIMTEELSGLFNPFYATSGADMDVVGMTQIGMLSTDDNGKPEAGDHLPTVVKDFEVDDQSVTGKTIYKFVIKNDLKFSDGTPLTMNDVIFNMYEYLDPVYTGSSTMYSVDIEGLANYRTQTTYSDDKLTDEADQKNNEAAAGAAEERIYTLYDVYQVYGLEEDSQSSYSLTESEMLEAIDTYKTEYGIPDGYKEAVAYANERDEISDDEYAEMLKEDYKFALKTFKKELEDDFKAAKESFDLTTDPYKAHASLFKNDIFKFFYYEGYITPKYKEDKGKKDKTVIESFEYGVDMSKYKTKEAAINRIYGDYSVYYLDKILYGSGTAGTLQTQFTADALDVILHEDVSDDGSLLVPSIKGIVSLGHQQEKESTVSVNGKNYKLAQAHDENGVPSEADAYDILQITVNGTDPKAIYNFGFTVAPVHYYTAAENGDTPETVDIVNNKFGVKFANSNFQSKVIQSQKNVEVPLGAGAFKATNAGNSDTPKGSDFWNSNVVYYKANDEFEFPVKAKKLRMQVVSPSNAIDKLKSGEVDYITPQFTKDNYDKLDGLKSKGIESLSSWQLGYGYIGINAGKVPNINIRRAIMAAMEAEKATTYYAANTCEVIDYPISKVSWAYPRTASGAYDTNNGWDYTQWAGVEAAKTKIQNYMNEAGVVGFSGDEQLKIEFTIAGASITEHPTYAVFKQAATILNDMGWDVEVKADSQALTKISTGALQVWAAAWGSTVDPDMYQVYHKNSKATSVYAWGYREIFGNENTYSEEVRIINKLSGIIDEARSYMKDDDRKPLYKQALGLVLELAVEMPVYQRKTLYAYNSKTLAGISTEAADNPYASPLEEIWNLELIA